MFPVYIADHLVHLKAQVLTLCPFREICPHTSSLVLPRPVSQTIGYSTHVGIELRIGPFFSSKQCAFRFTAKVLPAWKVVVLQKCSREGLDVELCTLRWNLKVLSFAVN